MPPFLQWAWVSLPYLLCNTIEISDEKSHDRTQNLGVFLDFFPLPIVSPNRSTNYVAHPSFALQLHYATSVQALAIFSWAIAIASVVYPCSTPFPSFLDYIALRN